MKAHGETLALYCFAKFLEVKGHGMNEGNGDDRHLFQRNRQYKALC